jgi:HlyD family secretion protein
MKGQTRKRLILIGAGVAVLALLVFAFLPDPIPVEIATVQRGTLRVTVEEEGRTQVADRYAITAPVSAYLRRIDLEVGDTVEQGDPVVTLAPPRMPILDARAQAEAVERVRAARATADRAGAERARMERLAASDAATPQALEQARAEAERAAAELAAAEVALQRTEGTEGTDRQPIQRLTAPISGSVLAVRRESEGQVNPGDTLVVIGNPSSLEVHVDVLSEDAVRIRPGTRVVVGQWGGDTTLEASVRRVEPQGFTKVSSLGVEEQRVNVVAALTSPPGLWAQLGSGYRVVADFVLWEGSDVLQVPAAALFRVGDGWAVFVIREGRAVRRSVTVGRQAGLDTQILDGLQEGDSVVVHPGNAVEDGVRVEAG